MTYTENYQNDTHTQNTGRNHQRSRTSMRVVLENRHTGPFEDIRPFKTIEISDEELGHIGGTYVIVTTETGERFYGMLHGIVLPKIQVRESNRA